MRLLSVASVAGLASAGPVAQKALERVDVVCEAVKAPKLDLDVADRKKAVETFVGDNVIEMFIEDERCHSENSDIMSECIEDKKDDIQSAATRVGGGFTLGILLLVGWVILLPCFLCRCWRRACCWFCLGESKNGLRSPKQMARLACVLIGLALTLALLIAGSIAVGSQDTMSSGADGTFCEIYKLANNSLNGYPGGESNMDNDDPFTGIVPMIDSIKDLVDELDPNGNGELLPGVDNLLTQTRPLDRAVADLIGTLENMMDTLGKPENSKVGEYTCVFCDACCGGSDPIIGQVLTELRESAAGALNEARDTVRQELKGQAVIDLHQQASEAIQPLDDFRDVFEDKIGDALINNESDIRDVLDLMNTATLGWAAGVFLPIALLILVVLCGCVRKPPQDYTDKVSNPCAVSCSCCITWVYAFIACYVSGIVMILAYFEGSICMIIHDVPKIINLYDDIQSFADRSGPTRRLLPALPTLASGRKLAGENDDIKNFLGTCLSPDGDGDILSTISVGNNQTLRDTFNVEDRIKTEFDKITNSVGADINDPSLNIANMQVFQDLLNAIDAIGDLYVLEPNNISTLQADADYTWNGNAPPSATAGADILTEGFSGVPECADRLIDLSSLSASFRDPISSLDGQTLRGVDHYINTLGTNGVSLGTATTCATFKATGATQNLVPWGNLINLRKEVMTKTDFDCTGYTLSENADGKFVTAPDTAATCNFDQWRQFIRNFKTQLQTKAAEVDTQRVASFDNIDNGLRDLVDRLVVVPIAELLEGISCRFMAVRWEGFINQFCWTYAAGVTGFGGALLAACGIMVVVLIYEFVIWRYLKDNRCIKRSLAKEARTHPAQSPQVGAAPQVGVPLTVQINVQK
ncbi:hypothetical protein FOL47_007567 [Perkinsus chesapeaki]|uniref:Uncharacterized protein n=1 Tax=Perkinsus chesapeaki TaxID=330153 RepID=A0A7J6LK03_PERCH|nr:hypothetical protein FOL47_007567 [Perkinsus chesapeaki]